MFEKDYFRYLGEKASFINRIKLFFNSPGYTYTVFMRLGQTRVFFVRFFFRFVLRFFSRFYGIQIPASTKIGEGLFIGHFGTIVVNAKSSIGKNCNISQGVTIGQTNRGQKKGVPIIGNEVWIGPNAVIVGKITIGNNVLIAPNTFVNIDIPDDSLVFGNPCVIKHDKDATLGYINNKL